MQVHQGISSLPHFNKSIITIGTFDGVHLGHQKIIHALTNEAKAVGGESVLITFHPHPRKIVQQNVSLQLINTLDEKIQLLQQHQIDHLVIVPFTADFAEQSAEEYIENFLVKNFRPHSIIIGYDHHFGKNRGGNFILLEDYAPVLNYQLKEIPKHILDEIDISSTKIRNSILKSDIATANKLLGYSFYFEGEVVKGDALGRTLGYPTANLAYTDKDKIHLGDGVYAVYVDVKGSRKKGMLSIGNRPTLKNPEQKIEVNIFDFDEEIYGEKMTVHIQQFLRPQEKYDNLDQLKLQLAKDKEQSLQLL